MKPNIAIVGSAELITDEINTLWNELTAGGFPAEQLVTTDVNSTNVVVTDSNGRDTVTVASNTTQAVDRTSNCTDVVTQENYNILDFDIYICAPSQRDLLNQLPAHKVFSIELVPTAAFFLRIASVPKGSTIHLFNNLKPYIQRLIAYCQKLGLTDYTYVPIAFDEQSKDTVCKLLSKAKYIIGVDRFIDAELTDAERIYDTESSAELINRDTAIYTGASVGRFTGALNKDVTIIKATRTLALKDTSRVLAAIAKFYMSQPISQDEQTTVATQLTNITMQVLASQADLKASVGTELELNSEGNGGMTLGRIRELLLEMGR